MSRILPVLALLCVSALGQRYGGAGEDWYTLGGIQAKGDVVMVDGVVAIEVKRVHDKGNAAKGGLAVGDRIVKVGGEDLVGTPDEVVMKLCRAIETAEETRPRGPAETVSVEVLDAAGATAVREIPVHFYGPWTDDVPTRCKRSKAILDEAVAFLAKMQSGEGHFVEEMANQNQNNVTTALAGLAFAGSGQRRHAKNHQEALEYLTRHVLFRDDRIASPGANWNQTNWSLSYGAIFLAETYARRKKKSVRETLDAVVAKLQENQEQSGGWAHGPGGPNALDYLELEIMSNYALAGLGMARSAGVELDQARRIKAVEWVKACTTDGGVAYSPRPGQAGHGDAGRTAGAYWALRLLGEDGELTDAMWSFFSARQDEVLAGHVSPAMHLLAGGLAAAVKGEAELAAYWKTHRSYVLAARDRDGAFDAWPTEESRALKSNSDRGSGRAFITAHMAILMELGGDRFELLDVPARQP